MQYSAVAPGLLGKVLCCGLRGVRRGAQLRTGGWRLSTARCTLHAAHRTLHTPHRTLHTAHCTPHAAPSSLPTATKWLTARHPRPRCSQEGRQSGPACRTAGRPGACRTEGRPGQTGRLDSCLQSDSLQTVYSPCPYCHLVYGHLVFQA